MNRKQSAVARRMADRENSAADSANTTLFDSLKDQLTNLGETIASTTNIALDAKQKIDLQLNEGRPNTFASNIVNINTEIDGIDDSIYTLQTDVNTIETTILTIETDIDNIQSDINNIEIDISAIQTELGTLSGGLSSVNGDIATLYSQTGTLLSIAGGNTSNIGTLNTDLSGISSTLDNVPDVLKGAGTTPDDGQFLKYVTSAGDWVAADLPLHAPRPYIKPGGEVSTFYFSNMVIGDTFLTLNAYNRRIILMPWICPYDCTVNEMGVYVTASPSTASMAVGIYASDSLGQPTGSPVVVTSTLDGSTTGFKSDNTLSQALEKNVQYWVGVWSLYTGGTLTLRAVGRNSMFMLYAHDPSLTTGMVGFYKNNQAGFPDPSPTGLTVYNTTCPAYYIGVTV